VVGSSKGNCLATVKNGPTSREQELIEDLLQFKYDPEGFVRYAFPWGVPNTPLAKISGPRTWQLDIFKQISDHLMLDIEKQRIGLGAVPVYLSISSGRGIGKSALLAMLNMWLASCWVGATGIVTANTETQLRSRTMAELGKWHTMSINRHWFEKSSMSLRPTKWFAEILQTQLSMDTQYYYVEAQSWSEENPDAFAGAHSQIGMMVSFDEASGIPDPIWQVTEGFFTDLAPLRLWINISNPRRNTGRFFECFNKDREFWDTRSIDSRTVEGVDASVYQRIADKYGEDHDVTRVEVKGEFPRTGSNQFIGREVVQDALTRAVEEDSGAPLLMGVDVARFGDDESVIRFRRGRDARTIRPVGYKGLNTMELADEVARLIELHNPDAVFVDGGGVGGGVVDRLKQLGYRVIEVQSGERARDPDKYLNRRAEMWGELREWLVYGAIDGEQQLIDDLTGPEYSIHLKGQIKLETKDSMKKRGLKSPDHADALALTFAEPVARNDMNMMKRRAYMSNQTARMDYNIFGA
jgi:hypothetical protein